MKIASRATVLVLLVGLLVFAVGSGLNSPPSDSADIGAALIVVLSLILLGIGLVMAVGVLVAKLVVR